MQTRRTRTRALGGRHRRLPARRAGRRRARGLRGAPRGLRGLPRGGRRAAARRAGAADLRRADRPAAGAEGADHGRGRARGLAAGRRRPRGRPAAGAGAPPPAAGCRSLHVPRLAPAAVAAALLLVGIGIGIGVTQLGSGDGRTIAGRRSEHRAAPSGRAELEINGDEATLVARGLPAPPRAASTRSGSSATARLPSPTAALFTPSRDGTATASVPGLARRRRPGAW